MEHTAGYCPNCNMPGVVCDDDYIGGRHIVYNECEYCGCVFKDVYVYEKTVLCDEEEE